MVAVIVTGADGTDTATQAGRTAARLAVAMNAELVVVCAYASPRVERVEKAGETFVFSSEGAAQQVASVTRQTLLCQFPFLGVTAHAVEGSPADALVRVAEDVTAELIVVGNKRVQGPTRVLGSIAADVARKARCDVYIANTHARK